MTIIGYRWPQLAGSEPQQRRETGQRKKDPRTTPRRSMLIVNSREYLAYLQEVLWDVQHAAPIDGQIFKGDPAKPPVYCTRVPVPDEVSLSRGLGRRPMESAMGCSLPGG